MKWTWLLARRALAGFLLARRRTLGRLTLAGGAIVTVAAAVLVGIGVIDLPNIEKLIEDAGTALGKWTYLLVGVLAFLETGAFVGLVAPGETAVLVGGLVAGQGQISLFVLIAIVWTCAVAGDLTSYTLGRRLGRAWLLAHGERLKITEDRLHQVERFFERAGGLTILVGRFIGLVRALAPFIAGTSRMPLRVFLPYDILGAGAWAATFCVLGYVFWQSFDRITQYVSTRAVRVRHGRRDRRAPVPARPPAARRGVAREVQGVAGRARGQAAREAAAARRGRCGGGCCARRPAGSTRRATFVLHRVKPGQLGLELTTLVALLAVGAFTFVLLARHRGEAGEPRIDEVAADIADQMRFTPLTDVIKVLTDVGSSPFVGAVVLLTALWALRRGRWIDAARADRRRGALVLRHPRRQGRVRPRAAAGPVRRHHRRRLPVRPRAVRRSRSSRARRCWCARAWAGRSASRS